MSTPSDVVAKRVREIRRKHGLTVAQLAQRCAELGMPELTSQAIYNLEAGRKDRQGRRRRAVTVDELLALAAVLDVAPVWLLVPADDDDKEPYQVTPTRAELADVVRNWVRGDRPLPGTDWRRYIAEGPSEWGYYLSPDEWEEHTRLAALERRLNALEQRQAQENDDG